MDIISRCSQDCRTSSLLFVDVVVHLASSNQDLQCPLGEIAVECEAAGMGIGSFKVDGCSGCSTAVPVLIHCSEE